SGTVVDEDKRPVAAATLAAQNVSSDDNPMMFLRVQRPFGSAISGPDGRFVVRTEGDREIQVHASRKGFPSGKSAPFRVAQGERKSGVVISIPRGMALTGRVTDRDGKPLSGVAVTATEAQRSAPGGMRRVVMAAMRSQDEDQIQTGSDGTFTIRLKEGAYDLAFKREGFAVTTVRGHQVSDAARPLEVVLNPGVEISGRVVRNSAGIEGVNVFGMSSEGGQTSAVTGPDGSFTLSDLTPGSMMVNISKQDEFIQQMRTINAPSKDVLFEVPAGGRITGRVVDKTTKQPVTNFQAGLSRVRGGGGMVFAGPPQLKSFTTDDGTFALEGVPSGQQTVVVHAAGYAEGRVPSIAVEEGKTVADVTVEMDRGTRVTGKVTGPDGAALSGATVRLAPQSMMGARIMSPTDPTTVTDASGEYVLEGIEAGERTFEFMQQGLISTQKTVQITGREVRVDAQLSAGQRVTGQVVTQSGGPVADAMVSARSGASGSFSGRSARTDASGMFTLENLAPGRYTISASKDGLPNGRVEDFDISSGAPLRIVLPAGGVVYGRVTGLEEADLRQTTVYARGAQGGASGSVDGSGNYRIEGAPTGTLRVSAAVESMGTRRSSPEKSVVLEGGGSVQLDLEFPADVVIRGRVTREGKPLAGARILFVNRDTGSRMSADTSTDESGQYSVTGLTNGTYSVAVMDLQRMAPFNTSYEVRGSGSFDIDIRSAQLRGRVVDAANGSPLGRTVVQVRSGATGPEAMLASRSTETDDAGAFLIDSITPGTYNATFSKDGYGSETREVIVRESGTDSVEIKLAKNEGISLKVVDGRDKRTLNASVTVYDAQNRVLHDEMFRFGVAAESVRIAVPPGQYRATVSADGYAPRNVILTSPGHQYVELTPGGTIVIRSKAGTLRRAKMLDANGQPYSRFRTFNPTLTIDPAPGTTTFRFIAPGNYTIQILGDGDVVVGSQVVTVMEGQTTTVEM
ncbi:MAG TPA: carboxypeptidase-like regulatory domain-containing protein, partial [Thermoanaerobaculia bacterium]|nr:carboxypeptidase-like regulatory domain-containing protein [Thermoanaerobaculia bacterium]